MKKYTRNITVASWHADQFGKASICHLFYFMLEAAWAHAQIMDWGYDLLQKQNMYWVLSRINIEIDKYPSWQDEIILNTWSAGTDGMFAYREFILESKDHEVLLRGNSAWLILNIETKRIIRLVDFKDTFPRCNEEKPCREPQRLKPCGNHNSLVYTPILFNEIDINKHFNSVKSLERVLDHYGIDFLATMEPSSIEINYLKEGLPGDWLAVASEQVNECSTNETIVRQSDHANISTMQINWRKRV